MHQGAAGQCDRRALARTLQQLNLTIVVGVGLTDASHSTSHSDLTANRQQTLFNKGLDAVAVVEGDCDAVVIISQIGDESERQTHRTCLQQCLSVVHTCLNGNGVE